MIDLEQIKSRYPESLHKDADQLLREYLQYLILEIVGNSPQAPQLVFLGGTCLRLVYESQRWSEDLDFDNQGLDQADFDDLARRIEYQLGLRGYTVQTRTLQKGAFHCHIRFPGILFQYGLSGHKEARILIKLDAERQAYDYEPRIHTLRKFDVLCAIKATPPDLLLSQKIAAAIGRKRPKGRDFYDIRFLLERGTRPDYGYLRARFGVDDAPALRRYVLDATAAYDFAALAADVRPFLFHAGDAEGVRSFPAYWDRAEL